MTSFSNRILCSISILLYFLVGGYLVYLSKDQINPDAVAYIQNARHYAEGNFGLAVNSYFGPFLSWVLVPGCWLGLDPQLFFKILNMFFGLGFAFASIKLMAELEKVSGFAIDSWIPLSLSLMLSLNMIPEIISPDMLLAFIFSWYLLFSFRMISDAAPQSSYLAGILGGLGYLTKGYVLPFFIAHQVVLFVLRRRGVKQDYFEGSKGKPFGRALASFLAVMVPWVIIISIQDGGVTIGSSGKYTDSMTRERQELGAMHSVHRLAEPKEGRVSTWENPPEILGDYFYQKKETSDEYMEYRVNKFLNQVKLAFLQLKNLDRVGLFLGGVGVSLLVLGICWRRLNSLERFFLIWSFFTLSIFVGGYTLIYVEQRYLWPLQGILVVLFLYCLLTIKNRFFSIKGFPKYSPFLFYLLLISMFVSLEIKNGEVINRWREPQGFSWISTWFRDTAGRYTVEGKITSNRWFEGLYQSYWQQVPFIGKFTGKTPELVLKELKPFEGPLWVLIYFDSELARRFLSHPAFELMAASEAGEPFMMVLRIRP